jgi:tRNA-dihydrouridine synthase B
MVAMTAVIVKSTHLPVTVKTRLGWDNNSKYIVDVAERLQDVGIKAISIHGRTRVQMYKGVADWTLIGEIKENPRMKIPVFGNGDVDSPEKALEMRNKYGVDGIMIGRASIGYPWIFDEIKHFMETGEKLAPPTIQQRVQAARRHLEMALAWKGDRQGVLETRRHYANYFKGFPNFKPYRMKMVTSDNPQDVFDTLDEVLAVYAEKMLA